MSDAPLQELCEKIYSINQHIRFAGVITKMGRLVAGGMRPDIESLEDRENSSKLYVQFALMTEMRKDFDDIFGKAIYSFTEREKIKLASFPLDDNHILRVSIEKKEKDHAQIIQNILDTIGTPIRY
ncbi:MAG TPA: DUF6659 family protein [Nitrososphaeraceae archaeon]|jgi:hypothetical protein|nr:DUF6659 family protein [Nitrososphaeraceae archaeon]